MAARFGLTKSLPLGFSKTSVIPFCAELHISMGRPERAAVIASPHRPSAVGMNLVVQKTQKSTKRKNESNGETSPMTATKVEVVIPARYGSTRLPGKPLEWLAGKPMIQRGDERAQRAGRGERGIGATPDERVVESAEGCR